MLLKDFAAKCDLLWPVASAEDWDKPGLAVGSRKQEIAKVLLAVDVTAAVIDEAISIGANLLFTHHPLLLKGLTDVSEDAFKGSLVTKAIRANLALFSAHTNADIVQDGVSDVFAKRIGLANVRPLVATGSGIGHGRIGELAVPIELGELVSLLIDALPNTQRGISASAPQQTLVKTVAVCGGAGDSFIGDAFAAGADVYVTSDLRHHVTQEAPLPLVDVPHWASESLWLGTAAAQLADLCEGVEFQVSKVVTDPWVFNQGRTK